MMQDAITRAYELGAPFLSATVTIKLIKPPGGGDYHMIRPFKSGEFPYVSSAYDD